VYLECLRSPWLTIYPKDDSYFRDKPEFQLECLVQLGGLPGETGHSMGLAPTRWVPNDQAVASGTGSLSRRRMS
jgi:hypothetical protein